ncbi:MAG: nitrilase family protein, partial [Muribaculaceae bacterium]|nr:nitrilase family protein [Muribaculaceae bacterium]
MAFSRDLKITLIEDDVAWGDRSANMAQLRRNLQNTPDDTDIVVLPELFSTGMIVESKDAAT